MSTPPPPGRGGIFLRHRRILREGSWVVVGQSFTALGLLVSTRVLTELLPPHVFGSVSLLLAFWSLLRLIFVVSVGNAALRFYPPLASRGEAWRLRIAASALLRRVLPLPVIAILLVGAIASASGEAMFTAFLCLALLMVVDAWRSYEQNYLVAARRQKEAALLEAGESLLRPAVAVPAILILGAFPQTVILVYAAAAGALLLTVLLVLRRDGVDPPADSRAEAGSLEVELRRYAVPLMPKAAVAWVNALSDRYIIGALRGPGQVGLYAATYGLISQPFLIAQEVVARTLTPSYFLAVSDGDRKSEAKIFKALLYGTMGVCALGVVLVFLLHRQIATLILAEAYRSSSYLMPPVALGNALLAVEYVFERHLFAHKRTKDIFFIQLAGAVASVLTTVPLVYAYGAWGAALACPIYNTIQLLIAMWRTRKTI